MRKGLRMKVILVFVERGLLTRLKTWTLQRRITRRMVYIGLLELFIRFILDNVQIQHRNFNRFLNLGRVWTHIFIFTLCHIGLLFFTYKNLINLQVSVLENLAKLIHNLTISLLDTSCLIIIPLFFTSRSVPVYAFPVWISFNRLTPIQGFSFLKNFFALDWHGPLSSRFQRSHWLSGLPVKQIQGSLSLIFLQ